MVCLEDIYIYGKHGLSTTVADFLSESREPVDPISNLGEMLEAIRKRAAKVCGRRRLLLKLTGIRFNALLYDRVPLSDLSLVDVLVADDKVFSLSCWYLGSVRYDSLYDDGVSSHDEREPSWKSMTLESVESVSVECEVAIDIVTKGSTLLYIKTWYPNPILLHVEPTWTIDKVTIALYYRIGICPTQQNFTFEGRQLATWRTLDYYDIRAGSTLHLTLPTTGSPTPSSSKNDFKAFKNARGEEVVLGTHANSHLRMRMIPYQNGIPVSGCVQFRVMFGIDATASDAANFARAEYETDFFEKLTKDELAAFDTSLLSECALQRLTIALQRSPFQ